MDRDILRTIQALERRLRELESKQVKVPLRKGGGGGGGITVRSVATLPAIPTVGADAVYYTGGTPDQIWWAYAGQSVWTPSQFLTSDTGAPPA